MVRTYACEENAGVFGVGMIVKSTGSPRVMKTHTSWDSSDCTPAQASLLHGQIP